MSKKICFQVFLVVALAAVLEASYPVRNIADVVHAFEMSSGRMEMDALKGARKAVEDFEKKLADIRLRQETSSPEKFWETDGWQELIRQKSQETIDRLQQIDFLYARGVKRLYRYYSVSLNTLRSQKESEEDQQKIQIIDEALQELREHPRLKQARSVLEAYSNYEKHAEQIEEEMEIE